MKLQTSRPWRAVHLRLRVSWLPVFLLFAIVAENARATPAAASSVTAKEAVLMVHERVSLPDRAAEIGYFGTCPESPDGSTIAYIVYNSKPGPENAAGAGGSLYLCNADLTNHVKIRDIERIRWEDGASQIWLANDVIAYMDYLPDRGPVTYVVNKRGEVLRGPFQACLGHGESPNGSVLLWVDRRQYPNGSSLGPNGIYIYSGGTVTQVVDLEKDFGPLKDRLEGSDNLGEWSLYHPQLSTRGTYISTRLDAGKGHEHLVTCKSDGTDVRLFDAQKKPLHQQWYDDSTLFGHETVFKPADGGPRHRAKRWDRDGNYRETLAGVGNHPGISPNRKYLASDNLYQLDPVVVKLYRTRSVEPLALIMSESPGPVWKMRTHVNPTFSRDGRKLYFNKPVAGMPQIHRVDISSVIPDRD